MNTILQLSLRKCTARFVSSISSSCRPPLIINFLSPICGLQFMDYNRLKRSQMVTSKQLKFINRTLNNPSYRWSPIRRQSGSTMPIWDQHNKYWCESTVIKSVQWGRCTQQIQNINRDTQNPKPLWCSSWHIIDGSWRMILQLSIFQADHCHKTLHWGPLTRDEHVCRKT